MNTNVKRHSFPVILSGLVLILASPLAQAQPWYDSKGRPLTIKAGKVVLMNPLKQTKTLPEAVQKISSIVSARPEVSAAIPTEPRSANYRSYAVRRFSSYDQYRYHWRQESRCSYPYYYSPTFNNGIIIKPLIHVNRYRSLLNSSYTHHY